MNRNTDTPKSKTISHEQLQSEYDYARAQKLLISLLDAGFLTESEFNRITLLNRQSFSPSLASIM